MSRPDRRLRRSPAAVGVTLALALVAVAARRTLMVVRVQGSSMLPAYIDGDRLLAVRRALIGRVSRGDVIVVRAPLPTGSTEVLVKRVRAVGGDPLPGDLAGARVPPGAYFVQGDAGCSYDSRAFGVVGPDDVLAKVVRALGPR